MKEKLKPWLKAIQATVMIITVSFVVGFFFASGANQAGGLFHINVYYTE